MGREFLDGPSLTKSPTCTRKDHGNQSEQRTPEVYQRFSILSTILRCTCRLETRCLRLSSAIEKVERGGEQGTHPKKRKSATKRRLFLGGSRSDETITEVTYVQTLAGRRCLVPHHTGALLRRIRTPRLRRGAWTSIGAATRCVWSREM